MSFRLFLYFFFKKKKNFNALLEFMILYFVHVVVDLKRFHSLFLIKIKT
jgi:hypothetical protein